MQSRTHPSASTALRNSKAVDNSRPLPVGAATVYFLIAGVGCTIDLATKHWIFAWRGLNNDIWWIVEGYFGIETAINRGALFGMGQGYTTVFVTLSFIAFFGILYWMFAAGAVYDLLLTVALGAITGGILGNLYDRMGFWAVPGITDTAAVRDWILLCYGEYTWPNFNMADSLLVCGGILIGWHSFRYVDEEHGSADEKIETIANGDVAVNSGRRT